MQSIYSNIVNRVQSKGVEDTSQETAHLASILPLSTHPYSPSQTTSKGDSRHVGRFSVESQERMQVVSPRECFLAIEQARSDGSSLFHIEIECLIPYNRKSLLDVSWFCQNAQDS